MLRVENLLVASLNECNFEAVRHLDVNVVVQIIEWNQLDLSVVLGDPA